MYIIFNFVKYDSYNYSLNVNIFINNNIKNRHIFLLNNDIFYYNNIKIYFIFICFHKYMIDKLYYKF